MQQDTQLRPSGPQAVVDARGPIGLAFPGYLSGGRGLGEGLGGFMGVR